MTNGNEPTSPETAGASDTGADEVAGQVADQAAADGKTVSVPRQDSPAAPTEAVASPITPEPVADATQQHGGPTQQHGGPTQQYDGPTQQHGGPTQQFAPQQQYAQQQYAQQQYAQQQPGQPYPQQQPGQQYAPQQPGQQFAPQQQPTGDPTLNPYAPNPYAQNQNAQNQYAQNPYPQNQYGQNQYGQNPYGQSAFGQTAYGQEPQQAKGGRGKLLGIGAGVLVLVAAVVAVTAFLWPGWAGKNLDQNAVQEGALKVLTADQPEGYALTDVKDVECPSGQKVEVDATFTCSVKVNGENKHITITIKDSSGTYEVSRPTN